MAVFDDMAKHYFQNRKDLTMFDYNRDIEVPSMIKMIGNVHNQRVLDLGCGFGNHAEILSKDDFKRLVGIDISSEMVKFAKEKDIPNTEFHVGDMNEPLKFSDETFDVVYSSLAVHYLSDIEPLYKEVNRVLKENGIFIVSTLHPIRSTMNQNDPMMTGFMYEEGKMRIYGDYFTDEATPAKVNGHDVEIYAKSFKTMVKSALDSGFIITDYEDPKPRKESEKYDAELFKLTTTLPTFMIFKYQKITQGDDKERVPDYYDYLMWKKEI